MVTHMKTTIDIADALLAEAKMVAAKEGTTVRALVEEGLRSVLAGHESREGFRLRSAGFRGDGLRPGVTLEQWSEVLDAVYRGRGS
jgi:Bacterial antitoxin of type II TA system, VapB